MTDSVLAFSPSPCPSPALLCISLQSCLFPLPCLLASRGSGLWEVTLEGASGGEGKRETPLCALRLGVYTLSLVLALTQLVSGCQ